MGTKSAKNGPSFLGDTLSLALLAWWLYSLYTAFAHGRLPLIAWGTKHTVVFGLVWFFLGSPAIIGITSNIRNSYQKVVSLLFALTMTPLAIAYWSVQVLLTALIITSWFPSPLPKPFDAIDGSIVTGLIAIPAVALVSLAATALSFGLVAVGTMLYAKILKADPLGVDEEQPVS